VAILVRALTEAHDISQSEAVSWELTGVGARLEPSAAASAADILVRALTKTGPSSHSGYLARGLAAVAVRLEPPAAAQAADILLDALLTKPRLPGFFPSPMVLARGLAAVATHLEPKKTADTLVQVMTKIPEAANELAEAFNAVLTGTEAFQLVQRSIVLTVGVGHLSSGAYRVKILAPLSLALKPLPCRFSTQELVELLKQPTCIGPARRVVLDHLGNRYGRRFRDHWEFVHFAREHHPELNLTSPPQRIVRGTPGISR
jgi:hypothetical protein